jgi:hypothetical protein
MRHLVKTEEPAHYRLVSRRGSCSLWLLHLAPEVHPTTKLDGCDISLSQCPSPARLPSPVSISKHDIFQDPPEELVGRYDIVHVSLVICFVHDSQIKEIVRRLMMLLIETNHNGLDAPRIN